MLRGMLLDIDGTLLLSNDAHAHAWVDAYQEFGYDVPFENIKPLIGMGGDKLMAKLTPELNEEEDPGKAIAKRRGEIFSERYLSGLRPAPGARDLLQRLKSDGLSLAVATSAKGAELDSLLGAAGIQDLIVHTTTSDDASESKPEPDIIKAALQMSGMAAADVLMLGDSPYDIEAAAKAGVDVVAVRCGGHDRDLSGALAIYDSPADLLNDYEASPIVARLQSTVPSAAG